MKQGKPLTLDEVIQRRKELLARQADKRSRYQKAKSLLMAGEKLDYVQAVAFVSQGTCIGLRKGRVKI